MINNLHDHILSRLEFLLRSKVVRLTSPSKREIFGTSKENRTVPSPVFLRFKCTSDCRFLKKFPPQNVIRGKRLLLLRKRDFKLGAIQNGILTILHSDKVIVSICSSPINDAISRVVRKMFECMSKNVKFCKPRKVNRETCSQMVTG